MNTIITVLKKELKITLRDKRTLFTVLVLPAIIFPAIILITGIINKKVNTTQNEKQLVVATTSLPKEYENQLFSDNKFKVLKQFNKEVAEIALKNESIDAFIDFKPGFSKNIEALKTEKLNIYYKSTNPTIFSNLKNQIDILNQAILKKRIAKLGVSPDFIQPIQIVETNIASEKEQISQTIGGFLPYILVLFCFIGCLYPAIELTTGEKEKKTMETLLTTPACRFHILLGKILTMTIIGITTSIVVLLSMFININLFSEIPPDIANTIKDILSLKFIILLLGMLIPIAFFFSSILSAISIKARNFKEAQSIVQPIMFFIFLPIMVGFIPGIVLDWKTVWIPILNLSLATKEIIADTIDPLLYTIVVLANICLLYTSPSPRDRQKSRMPSSA